MIWKLYAATILLLSTLSALIISQSTLHRVYLLDRVTTDLSFANVFWGFATFLRVTLDRRLSKPPSEWNTSIGRNCDERSELDVAE